MTALEAALERMVDELRSADARFALVGGLAVSARAEPRLTRDADLAVACDSDEAAELLINALSKSGYQASAIAEHELTGRLATVRLTHERDGGMVTDLLFASSGIEAEIVAGAEELVLAGSLVLPVASIGHLIATKLLARDDRRRPTDADDLRALREVAGADDWAAAVEAVALIEERGYARGRDLASALRVVRESGPY